MISPEGPFSSFLSQCLGAEREQAALIWPILWPKWLEGNSVPLISCQPRYWVDETQYDFAQIFVRVYVCFYPSDSGGSEAGAKGSHPQPLQGGSLFETGLNNRENGANGAERKLGLGDTS